MRYVYLAAILLTLTFAVYSNIVVLEAKAQLRRTTFDMTVAYQLWQ